MNTDTGMEYNTWKLTWKEWLYKESMIRKLGKFGHVELLYNGEFGCVCTAKDDIRKLNRYMNKNIYLICNGVNMSNPKEAEKAKRYNLGLVTFEFYGIDFQKPVYLIADNSFVEFNYCTFLKGLYIIRANKLTLSANVYDVSEGIKMPLLGGCVDDLTIREDVISPMYLGKGLEDKNRFATDIPIEISANKLKIIDSQIYAEDKIEITANEIEIDRESVIDSSRVYLNLNNNEERIRRTPTSKYGLCHIRTDSLFYNGVLVDDEDEIRELRQDLLHDLSSLRDKCIQISEEIGMDKTAPVQKVLSKKK